MVNMHGYVICMVMHGYGICMVMESVHGYGGCMVISRYAWLVKHYECIFGVNPLPMYSASCR